MDNLRDKAAPAPNAITLSYWNCAAKQGVSNQSNHIQSVSTRAQLPIPSGHSAASGWGEQSTDRKQKKHLCTPPYCHPDSRLVLPPAQEGPAMLHTYRQICIEVVFSVKQGLLVYAAVESQACHHCCFYTSPVENLRKHDTWFCSDTQYVTNVSPTHCLIRSIYSISLHFSHH